MTFTITINDVLLWGSAAIWAVMAYRAHKARIGLERDRVVLDEQMARYKRMTEEFVKVKETDDRVNEALAEAMRTARLAVMVFVGGDEEMKYDLVSAAQTFAKADAQAAKLMAKVIEFRRQ